MFSVEGRFIHVTECDNVPSEFEGVVGITAPFAAHADAGDVNAAVEVLSADPTRCGHRGEAGGQKRMAGELTPGQFLGRRRKR